MLYFIGLIYDRLIKKPAAAMQAGFIVNREIYIYSNLKRFKFSVLSVKETWDI